MKKINYLHPKKTDPDPDPHQDLNQNVTDHEQWNQARNFKCRHLSCFGRTIFDSSEPGSKSAKIIDLCVPQFSDTDRLFSLQITSVW